MRLSVENIHFNIIEENDSELCLEFINDSHHKYYDGHFDDFKLLPALAQIHLCIEICKLKNMIVDYKKLANLKFRMPITPKDKAILIIENKNSRITFKYTTPDKKVVYSQGNIG
jgi:3-hydroxymyristoyl/3-hydroxydecanoyl-(acyl carrier protein) dehydratase